MTDFSLVTFTALLQSVHFRPQAQIQILPSSSHQPMDWTKSPLYIFSWFTSMYIKTQKKEYWCYFLYIEMLKNILL